MPVMKNFLHEGCSKFVHPEMTVCTRQNYFREAFEGPSRRMFNIRMGAALVVSAVFLSSSDIDTGSDAEVLAIMKEVVTGSGFRTSKSCTRNTYIDNDRDSKCHSSNAHTTDGIDNNNNEHIEFRISKSSSTMVRAKLQVIVKVTVRAIAMLVRTHLT